MARFSNMKIALFFVGFVCFVTIPGSSATMNRKILQASSGQKTHKHIAVSKSGVKFKAAKKGDGIIGGAGSEVQHVKGDGSYASGHYKAVGQGKTIGVTGSLVAKQHNLAAAKSAGAFKGKGKVKGTSSTFIGGGVKYGGSYGHVKSDKYGATKTHAVIKSDG